MNKEELKNIVSEIFGDSSEAVFNQFIEKIASTIKGNQALLLNSIGHFQIKKEPLSRMDRKEDGSSDDKEIVLFLPAGEINEDKIIMIEIDNKGETPSLYSDSIFDLGINESNSILETNSETLEDESEIVDESIQNNITEFVGSGEVIEGYRLIGGSPPISAATLSDVKESDEIISNDSLSFDGDPNSEEDGINEEFKNEGNIKVDEEIIADDNLNMDSAYNLTDGVISEEFENVGNIKDSSEITSDDNLSLGSDYNLTDGIISEELENEDDIKASSEIIADENLSMGSDDRLTDEGLIEDFINEDDVEDNNKLFIDENIDKGGESDLTEPGVGEDIGNDIVGDEFNENTLPFDDLNNEDDYDVTSSRIEPEITIDDVNASRSGITKADDEIDAEAKFDAEIEAKIKAELEKKIAAKNRAELVAKLAEKSKSALEAKVASEKKADLEASKNAEKKAEIDARIAAKREAAQKIAEKKAELQASMEAEIGGESETKIEPELETVFGSMIEHEEELDNKITSENNSELENEIDGEIGVEFQAENSELNPEKTNPFDELDGYIKDEKEDAPSDIVDNDTEPEIFEPIDEELQPEYPAISYSEFNQKTNKWYKNPILYITTFGLAVGIVVVYFVFPLSTLLKVEDKPDRFVIDSKDFKGIVDSTSTTDSSGKPIVPVQTSEEKLEDAINKVYEKKIVSANVTTLTGLYREINNDQSISKQIYFDGKRYTIQSSSWRSSSIAEREVLKLKKRGFDAFIYKAFIASKNDTWNRVRIGYFKSKKEAEEFIRVNKI